LENKESIYRNIYNVFHKRAAHPSARPTSTRKRPSIALIQNASTNIFSINKSRGKNIFSYISY